MNARDDMSDADVLTAARDFLSRSPVADPPDLEAIMASGRARRRRRLIPGVTGTLAVAAGAAVAVTTLAPASHPVGQAGSKASRQPSTQLAAWTVSKLSDGDISVTIRELKDPAGLQRTLRADGVPASVTFAGQLNAACVAYPGGTPGVPPHAGTPLLNRVFPKPYGQFHLLPPPHPGMTPVRQSRRVPVRPPLPRPSANQTVVVIDPSAIPSNAGVQLAASPGGNAVLVPALVYASPKCTGS